MNTGLALDLLLITALVWSATRALLTPDLARGVVLFIVFGLLMTVAWARLNAPDIALAEAAIGAGLTGALLLDALGVFRRTVTTDRPSIALRLAVLAGVPTLFGAFAYALLALPYNERTLPALVATHMDVSGVDHPVTAVLLNFRGYDTLLEVGVLLVAFIAMLAVHRTASTYRPDASSLVLRAFAAVATPLALLTAGYLLWAGAHQPGGAFQAAAVLAATAVLLYLAGRLPAWATPGRLLRIGLAAGFALFMSAGFVMVESGSYLTYPAATAGSWILAIEAGLTISLGLILAGLFLLLAGQRKTP